MLTTGITSSGLNNYEMIERRSLLSVKIIARPLNDENVTEHLS